MSTSADCLSASSIAILVIYSGFCLILVGIKPTSTSFAKVFSWSIAAGR